MEPVFRKGGYAILRCWSCGLVFASPHPTRDELDRMYSKSFFQVGEKFAGLARSPGMLNAERRVLRLLASPGVLRGRWLDVGCATGDFMVAARPHVKQITGIEMSTYAVDQARARGLHNVMAGDFLEVSFDAGLVDVVTMWDVIEHVPDPLAALRRAADVLRDDGMLVLSTGDVESLAARMTGRFWHLMIPPRHLYFFSPATIGTLLVRAGFEILSVSKPGKRVPLDFAFWKLATLVTPRAGGAALRLGAAIRLGRLAPLVNLRDIMTVVARKRPAGAAPSVTDAAAQGLDPPPNVRRS